MESPGASLRPPGMQQQAVPSVVHREIAIDIGQKVEGMILDAKRASESRVGKEIGRIHTKLEALKEKLQLVEKRVIRMEPALKGLLKTDLGKSIAKLEEVWDGEVGTLKHELWQTIQAHNHNADLLKHHKDAIDQIQTRTADAAPPSPEVEQVNAQLLQLDKIFQREQTKDAQIDQLVAKFHIVQQQLQGGGGGWSANPATAGFTVPSIAPAAAATAAVAGAAAGKRAQRKAAKPTKTPKSAGAAPAGAAPPGSLMLRAEAPEFVPTTPGWAEP